MIFKSTTNLIGIHQSNQGIFQNNISVLEINLEKVKVHVAYYGGFFFLYILMQWTFVIVLLHLVYCRISDLCHKWSTLYKTWRCGFSSKVRIPYTAFFFQSNNILAHMIYDVKKYSVCLTSCRMISFILFFHSDLRRWKMDVERIQML